MRKQLTKKFLLREYEKKEKSTLRIAEETGWSKSQIKKKLREFNIPARSNNRLGRPNNPQAKKVAVRKF